MWFAAGSAEDVFDLDSAGSQGVGDQGPVAPPGDCFRTHDRSRPWSRSFDQPCQALTKGCCLHVIRVAAEARIFPTGIDGILAGMAKPSEPRHMGIPDFVLKKRLGELLLPELRIPARLGYRPDVNEPPNTMSLEHFEELLDRERRVADGEDRQGFTTARRYERIAASSASL